MRHDTRTTSALAVMAASTELQGIFPQHSHAYLTAILTQHNGDLDLAVAALLAQATGEAQPLKVNRTLHKCMKL